MIYFISTGIIIYVANSNIPIDFQIIPKVILDDYSRESLSEDTLREFRLNIWINAINFIKIDPILGLGAGIFPILYLLKQGNRVAHTHNLFLELAFNHGILVAFTIIIFMIFLIFKSFYALNDSSLRQSLNNNFLNKTWWSSAVLLLVSQMVDLQYYDGRVSMTLWLLLSGLLSIMQDKNPALDH